MSVKWNLDKSHSEVQFKVKHMVISTVTGFFEEFEGEAETEDLSFDHPKFRFSAQVDSINTKNKDRDNHLKDQEFFDAEKFPLITFTSKNFSDGQLNGDLTIKGVTKNIDLDTDFGGVINDPFGKVRAGFEFSGEINRKDFGLNWSATTEAGGLVVSDKVKLIVNLEFTKL